MRRQRWNERYSEKEQLWPGDPSPVLKQEVETLTPGRALDLAAGEGRHALYLAQLGWDVTAVDFSEVAVQRGRTLADRAGLSITWEVADLIEYEPRREQFDLVCLFYLHMPWVQLEGVLRKAADAVRPGGTFLLVGHDRTNITGGSGGPKDPQVTYTPEEVVGVLKGFEIRTAQQMTNPVDHGSGEGFQIDCVVVAERG